MQPCPLPDQSQRTRRQHPVQDTQRPEFDLRDVLPLLGVKVRRRMIRPVHPDHNPVEHRQTRHTPILRQPPADTRPHPQARRRTPLEGPSDPEPPPSRVSRRERLDDQAPAETSAPQIPAVAGPGMPAIRRAHPAATSSSPTNWSMGLSLPQSTNRPICSHFKGERRDSNPRPPGPQPKGSGCAYPVCPVFTGFHTL
jgi:hypothetical protein